MADVTNRGAAAATPVSAPIRTEAENRRALGEIERLWGAPAGTQEGNRLDLLMILVEAYEREHHPMDPPDPIEAIKFRLEQKGYTRKDLEPMIGGSGRVAEVLGRKRPLSIQMIRKINSGLGVSLEVLIQPTVVKGKSRFYALGNVKAMKVGRSDFAIAVDKGKKVMARDAAGVVTPRTAGPVATKRAR